MSDDMTAVERAADIIATTDVASVRSWPKLGVTRDSAGLIAQALADVGLLRPEWATDEAKAVLDAVGVLCRTLFGHLPTLVDDIEASR